MIPVVAPAADRVGSSRQLERAAAVAAEHHSTALLVAEHGRLLAERYWKGWDVASTRPVASVSKTIVSVLVGICMHRGAIRDLEQPAADFISEWRHDGRSEIRIRHLLSMTSGLRSPPLWLLLLHNSPELTIGLDLVRAPGTHWDYNTAAYSVLLTVVERVTGQRIEDFAATALFGPAQMPLARWRERTQPGKHPLSVICAASDLLAFGNLLLQRGACQGRQLLDAAYVDAMLVPSQTLNRSYGLLIWLNQGPFPLAPLAPPDAAAATGASDTRLYVIPSRGLAAVRLGGWVQSPRERSFGQLRRAGAFDDQLLSAICDAREAAAQPEGMLTLLTRSDGRAPTPAG